MPSKQPSKAASGRELPAAVPGAPERLQEIARQVIGPRVQGRAHGEAARLQRAADRLDRLGRELLHGLQQQVTSPSAEALKAQLERVQSHAQALEEAVAGLPPFIQTLLNDAYWAQRRWNPGTRTLRPLGVGTAPAGVAASAIAAAAEQHLDSWQKGTVVGRAPPGQRGPMRAYQRIIGDPRAFVAGQVAQMVIAEQGAAAATAEQSGAVYAAVGQLWEWATGLPEAEANLRKHIRQGVRDALLAAKLDEV